MNKPDLRSEVKALRFQMAALHKRCNEREDKLVEILFILEPFINALSPDMAANLIKVMDNKKNCIHKELT